MYLLRAEEDYYRHRVTAIELGQFDEELLEEIGLTPQHLILTFKTSEGSWLVIKALKSSVYRWMQRDLSPAVFMVTTINSDPIMNNWSAATTGSGLYISYFEGFRARWRWTINFNPNFMGDNNYYDSSKCKKVLIPVGENDAPKGFTSYGITGIQGTSEEMLWLYELIGKNLQQAPTSPERIELP